jgi:enoyl-CoA hydratase
VGKAVAMDVILNGRLLTADEAARFGLVNRVVPVEVYLGEALALAQSIAARAPLAVRLAKEAVNNAFETYLADGLADERRAFYFLFSTSDQKEGMRAFIEKRPASWRGA